MLNEAARSAPRPWAHVPFSLWTFATSRCSHSARQKGTGPGAATWPRPDGITFKRFLETCLTVTGRTGHPVWVDPEVLTAHGVKQWTELPLWRTHEGVWLVDPSRATTAGLRRRPLPETVADTWAWMQGKDRPVPHPRWDEHGIDPSKETAVLASL